MNHTNWSFEVVPVFSSTATPILGPPLKPPSGFLASDIINSQDVRAVFVPPVIIEQLLDQPKGNDHFKKMDFVLYAGGPLSQSAGNSPRDVVDLCQYYGSTETSNIPQLLPGRENWAYMEWHPTCNIEMQPSELEEGTYEMVQFLDSHTRAHSPLKHNFPGLREWRTKDLFKPHPTNAKLWQFSGRVDDIIVLSNGHKFNPVAAEAFVQEHPLVSGALIVGQGRSQAALLLELKAPQIGSAIDTIWPAVEQANSHLPGQGRISRTVLFVAPADKLFHRTGKNTVVRKLTEKNFAAETEILYARGGGTMRVEIPIWQTFEEDVLKRLLHAIVAQCLPNIQILDQDDFFLRGLDSLKTVEMIQAIRSGLRQRLKPSEVSKLSSRMVYANSSIDKLARALSNLLNRDSLSEPGRLKGEETPDDVTAMDMMVETYT